MKVGRFIHTDLDKSQLPTHFVDPSEGYSEKRGCQVLRLSRVLRMIEGGEDDLDDWYRGGDSYTHLAVLEVSGKSGESGRGHQSVTEDDIDDMRLLDLGSADWKLIEVWEEMLDDGHDLPETEMGLPGERWWEGREGEVIDRLFDRMESVDPDFVDTLD